MTNKQSKPSTNSGKQTAPVSDRKLAEVAWLYYIKGKTQGEIAKQLSLSRPTIISYLRHAKDRRLVTIKLSPEHFRINELAEKLCEKYSLTTTFVVPATENDASQTAHDVCEAAANFLPEWLQSGDTLGVSWGETIWKVAEALPEWGIDEFVVRQFIGSMANPVLNTSESCTTEIARKLSGYCINLNAPAVCTNKELASALRDEPIIKAQLSALSSCNKSIFSVSPCTQDTHAIHFKVATHQDIKEYQSKGAVGIVVGRFVNAQGKPVIGDLDARLFGADHDTILSTEGLLVVNGIEKHEATHAALVGGYVDRMFLDTNLAEALLNDD